MSPGRLLECPTDVGRLLRRGDKRQVVTPTRVEFGADSANLGLTALLPMESMNTHAWS